MCRTGPGGYRHLVTRRSSIVAWAGALAFPAVAYLTLLNVPRDSVALRVLLPPFVLALPAGLLRRWPPVALGLMLAGSFMFTMTLYSSATGYLQALVVDATVGVVAATRPRWLSVLTAVTVLPVQVAEAAYYTNGSDVFLMSVAFLALAMVAAWTVGNTVRERRDHAATLRSREAAEAVTAERLRIARELHDLVAHSIGIIAIQAGVGSRVMDTQPAEARNALTTIEATSRQTLAELRRTLGALRRAEPGPADLDPAPGLADVDRLVASTADAGVRVDVRWWGERRPLPADVELSAFRIIQEAVTNVVRHAGTRDCQVTIDYRDDNLSIEIVDDGRGCVVVGPGFGITGMRERVGLLGGRFSAGPRPGGGFGVAARLPVPA
jgi:signal transduction histidine kinase